MKKQEKRRRDRKVEKVDIKGLDADESFHAGKTHLR